MTRATRTAALLVAVVLLAACDRTPPEELLRQADEALEAGEVRAAVIHLRNLLEQDESSIEATLRLAELYLLGGDARTADRFFSRAERLGAAPERFLGDWLRALLQSGKYPELLARTERAPDFLPAEEVLALRGYALQGVGRLRDAEAAFRAAIEAAPSLPSPHADLAQLLLETGRGDDAGPEIAAALAIDPGFAPALVLRGSRQFAAGDVEAAEATYAEAIELADARFPAPLRLAARSGLAEIRLFRGDLAGARTLVDEMAGEFGERVPVRYLQAQLAAQSEDLEGAITRLQSILGDEPDHVPSQRLLGSIHALQGELNLAELYLKMAVTADARDRVARGLLAAVRLRQNDPAAAIALLDADPTSEGETGRAGFLALAGQANLQAGNVDRALAFFDAGATAFPGDWRFALGQALAYLGALRTDEAILLLESLDEQEAPEVRGTTLVLSYVQKGDLEKADAEARRLVRTYPDAAWAHNLLGAWRLQSQDFAAAAESFARAYLLEPTPERAAALAEARVRGGIEAPAELLEDWLGRNPDNLPTLHAMAQVALASGDLGSARDYYEDVIAADPQHVGALNNLAWVYQELGDRRAIEVARNAYGLARNNPAVMDTLGWTLVRFEQPDEARRILQRAADAEPDNAEIGYHLAVALLRSGADGDGRRLLAEVLESDAPFPSRPAAEQQLAALQ